MPHPHNVPREALIVECDHVLKLCRAAQIDAAPGHKGQWAERLDAALDIRSRLMAARPAVPAATNPTTT